MLTEKEEHAITIQTLLRIARYREVVTCPTCGGLGDYDTLHVFHRKFEYVECPCCKGVGKLSYPSPAANLARRALERIRSSMV